jgi:hypothetical protein
VYQRTTGASSGAGGAPGALPGAGRQAHRPLKKAALYERAGFRVVERVDDDRYSLPLTSLKMELELRPEKGRS